MDHRIPISDVGAICVGCGLCCDGTLLSHLAVADESDLGLPLRLRGVELVAAADPPGFALPCPAFGGGRCAVYEQHRPHACHEFECGLLLRVRHGAVGLAEARAVVAAVSAEPAGPKRDALIERWFR